MSELTRREFLKSLGAMVTAISVPVTIELITKPFIQTQSKNYLILQAAERIVVGEVRAINLAEVETTGYLQIVFEETFDIRQIINFVASPSMLTLELFNGIPMKFEGAGLILYVYRIAEGNCIDIKLDSLKCTTGGFQWNVVDYSSFLV